MTNCPGFYLLVFVHDMEFVKHLVVVIPYAVQVFLKAREHDNNVFQGFVPGSCDHRFSKQDLSGIFTGSEEHTSELQSLMRISYAVFCLKKKKDQIMNTSLNYNTT